MTSPDDHQAPLQPTTPRELVLSAIAGAVVCLLLLSTLDARGTIIPITPWSLAFCFALLGAGAYWYARQLRRRLDDQRANVTSVEGVRALVAGKVLALTGAVMAGAHLAYAMKFLSKWDVPAPRERVIHGVITLLAAIVMAYGGRHLEQACITGSGPDDHDADDAEVPQPGH